MRTMLDTMLLSRMFPSVWLTHMYTSTSLSLVSSCCDGGVLIALGMLIGHSFLCMASTFASRSGTSVVDKSLRTMFVTFM